jgi:hypothetical protein
VRTRGNDCGAALLIVVVCMLILGVFALSVAVLADLEIKVGGNHKAAQQALGLAEAGLEHGRNIMKSAVTFGNLTDFTTFINSASARQLGIPGAGISLGSGHYWVRVDNDCPPFVPAAIQDTPGGACPGATDTNKTVVVTAWAETTDAGNRVIGRARVRAHYTMGGAWGHSCYNGNDQLCIQDDVGGCNNNPCVDPSDPDNPNGPAKGPLPLPTDIRCGTAGIDSADIPSDVYARMTTTSPCVIYPYYKWAIHTDGPMREVCYGIPPTGGGYGSNPCPGSSPVGTKGWNPADAICIATPSKCHGLVFFGPPSNLATGANIQVRATGGNPDIRCVGYQRESSTINCYNGALTQSDSKVLYVMGKVGLSTGAVQGTVVLHGDGLPAKANADFGLQGQSQVTSRPCVAGSPAPSPGCGYPLAILAYDPNNPPDPTPTTATGQTIFLDMSNTGADTKVSGLIYTGGTAEFNPINVDGGVMAWDVNILNTASRINYNPTYGNAAPPPGFPSPSIDPSWTVSLYRATWVHCTNYANDFNGPTSCD